MTTIKRTIRSGWQTYPEKSANVMTLSGCFWNPKTTVYSYSCLYDMSLDMERHEQIYHQNAQFFPDC
jgi:hypothetical protein